MNFFFENLSLVPETRQVMEHFKLVFGSGTSDLAKIRPLKNWTPAINRKSSLYGNFHLFLVTCGALTCLKKTHYQAADHQGGEAPRGPAVPTRVGL